MVYDTFFNNLKKRFLTVRLSYLAQDHPFITYVQNFIEIKNN